MLRGRGGRFANPAGSDIVRPFRGMAMWQTNGGEIAAFFLARAIAVALYYGANSMFLGPIFTRAYMAGGRAAMMAVGIGAALVGWLITLLLFVLFRAGLGSVPPA